MTVTIEFSTDTQRFLVLGSEAKFVLEEAHILLLNLSESKTEKSRPLHDPRGNRVGRITVRPS